MRLSVIGTWLESPNAQQFVNPPAATVRHQEGARRRPVTRSQASKDAASAAPAASAATHEDGRRVKGQDDAAADARFHVTASPIATSVGATSTRRCVPVIRVSDASGAPAPATTRVKVIVYPLPSPNHGYLALRSPSPREVAATRGKEAAGGLAWGGADGRNRSDGATVGVANQPAKLAINQTTAAAPTDDTSHSTGGPTPLELAIRQMNCAAAAMAALDGCERRETRRLRRGWWAGALTAFLCSSAAGSGRPMAAVRDKEALGVARNLLEHAISASALLTEVSRRVGLVRRGVHRIGIGSQGQTVCGAVSGHMQPKGPMYRTLHVTTNES